MVLKLRNELKFLYSREQTSFQSWVQFFFFFEKTNNFCFGLIQTETFQNFQQWVFNI